MKESILIFILVTASVFGLLYILPHDIDTTHNEVIFNDTDTAHYEVIFNEYRQSKGREPLIFTDDLNRIAGLRLEEVKKNYSHSSQGDYNKYLGENIVNFVISNEEALKSWQGSWLHDANMLDSDCRYTGYAASKDLFGVGYAVQVFSEWITVDGIPQLPPGWHFDY